MQSTRQTQLPLAKHNLNWFKGFQSVTLIDLFDATHKADTTAIGQKMFEAAQARNQKAAQAKANSRGPQLIKLRCLPLSLFVGITLVITALRMVLFELFAGMTSASQSMDL